MARKGTTKTSATPSRAAAKKAPRARSKSVKANAPAKSAPPKAKPKSPVKPAPKAASKSTPATNGKAPGNATRILRAMLEIETPANIRWQLGSDNEKGVFEPTKDHTWSFSINRNKLHACEAEIKTALESFATLYIDNNDEETLIDALEKVVEKGQELADVLMTGLDADDEALAAKFRKFFYEKVARIDQASSDPNVAIEVVSRDVGHSIMTPAGLAFTRRKGRKRPTRLDFESYRDFWSNSFRAASFMQNHNKELPTEPASGEDFDIVIVREDQDNEPYVIVHSNLRKIKGAGGGLSLEKGEKVATTTKDIGGKIAATHGERCVLFYFDLEATERQAPDRNRTVAMRLRSDDDTFVMPDHLEVQSTFGANEARRSEALRNEALKLSARRGKPTYAVAVIDREAIIRGDRGAAWIRAFMAQPWNGVIAAECDIRSRTKPWKHGKEVPYDRLLGLLLMRKILQQRSERLVNALIVARRECWPYSLLYGVYCNPRQPWIDETQSNLFDDIGRLIPYFGEGHPANRHATGGNGGKP